MTTIEEKHNTYKQGTVDYLNSFMHISNNGDVICYFNLLKYLHQKRRRSNLIIYQFIYVKFHTIAIHMKQEKLLI